MDERLRLPKECIDGFNLSASLCVKYHPAIAKHFRDMLENYSYKRQISNTVEHFSLSSTSLFLNII